MSPILVRPVREQLEHDRIIRLLQAKFRRKFEAGINPGAEQNAPVGTGPSALYPDLVLLVAGARAAAAGGRRGRDRRIGQPSRGARRSGRTFAKLRAPFHLYVPAGMVDVARRLCEDNQIHVDEIWSYHTRRRRGALHARAPQPRGAAAPRAPRRPAASGGVARRAAAGCSHGEVRRPAGQAVTTARPRKRRSRSPRSPRAGRSAGSAAETAEADSVAFLKFSRDKRGYEHFYLVRVRTGRRGKTAASACSTGFARRRREGRPRAVRSHVHARARGAVSRRQVRLGATPDTPIPSVEPEHWRERRRVERAVRRRQEDEDADGGGRDAAGTGTGRTEWRPQDPAEPTRCRARGLETAAESPDAVDARTGVRPGPGAAEPGSRRRRRRRRGQRSPAAGRSAVLPVSRPDRIIGGRVY